MILDWKKQLLGSTLRQLEKFEYGLYITYYLINVKCPEFDHCSIVLCDIVFVLWKYTVRYLGVKSYIFETCPQMFQ